MEFKIIDTYNGATNEVIDHFKKHDADFYPPISKRMDILAYIRSIFEMNGKLITCYDDNDLIAAMGFVLDHPQWKNFYQYIAVDEAYRKKGIADKLLDIAEEILLQHGATRIVTRTWSSNNASQNLLLKRGFVHFKTVINDRSEGIHSYYYEKLFN